MQLIKELICNQIISLHKVRHIILSKIQLSRIMANKDTKIETTIKIMLEIITITITTKTLITINLINNNKHT